MVCILVYLFDLGSTSHLSDKCVQEQWLQPMIPVDWSSILFLLPDSSPYTNDLQCQSESLVVVTFLTLATDKFTLIFLPASALVRVRLSVVTISRLSSLHILRMRSSVMYRTPDCGPFWPGTEMIMKINKSIKWYTFICL